MCLLWKGLRHHCPTYIFLESCIFFNTCLHFLYYKARYLLDRSSKGYPIRVSSDCSVETLQDRRRGNQIFKYWKREITSPPKITLIIFILFYIYLYFWYEGEIKEFVSFKKFQTKKWKNLLQDLHNKKCWKEFF